MTWWAGLAAAALVLGWAWWLGTTSWAWPAFLVLAAAWAMAVRVDLDRHDLPDRYTLAPLPVVAIVWVVAAAAEGNWARLGSTLAAALVSAGVLFVLAFANPAGLGLGDVKLGLGTGAALGWVAGGSVWSSLALALLGVATAFVLMALVGVVLLVTRRATPNSDVAFGPFLVVGTLLAPVLASVLT